MGRGGYQDGSDYTRLRGDGYLQRGSRWGKCGKSMHRDTIQGLIQLAKSVLGVGIYYRTFASVVSDKVILTFWVRLFQVKAIET